MEQPIYPPATDKSRGKSSFFAWSRRQALLLLGTLVMIAVAAILVRESRPTRSMIRALRSGDDASRAAAATSLNDLSVVDLEPAIHAVAIAMVQDPSPDVRAAATRTMATLGSAAMNAHDDPNRDQAVGAMLAAYDDKDPTVRSTAMAMTPIFAKTATNISRNENDVRPLGAVDAVVAKLKSALDDPVENVRTTAAVTLGSFPVQLDSFLPELLSKAAAEPAGTGPRRAGSMTSLLRKARPLKGSVPVLIKSVDSPEPRVRYLAITTLGQAGPDAIDAIPTLIKILNDPAGGDQDDPGRAAALALAEIAPGTPRELETADALQGARGVGNARRDRIIDAALRSFTTRKP